MSNFLSYACIVVGSFFGFGSLFFLKSTQFQRVLRIVFRGFAPLLLSYGFYLIAMPKEMIQGELEAARIDTQKHILVNFGSNILSTDYKQIGTQGIDLRKMIDVGSSYPIRIRIEQGKMLVWCPVNN